MLSKKQCQQHHAKKRALERYGLNLITKDLRQLVLDIQNGKSKLIEQQSLRVSIREVEFNGEQVFVVYDSKRKSIVTFLPYENENTLLEGVTLFREIEDQI